MKNFIPKEKINSSTLGFINQWMNSDNDIETRINLIKTYISNLYDAYNCKKYILPQPALKIRDIKDFYSASYNSEDNTITVDVMMLASDEKYAGAQLAVILVHEFTHFRQATEGRYDRVDYVTGVELQNNIPDSNPLKFDIIQHYSANEVLLYHLQPIEREAFEESLYVMNAICDQWPDCDFNGIESLYVYSLDLLCTYYDTDYDHLDDTLKKHDKAFQIACHSETLEQTLMFKDDPTLSLMIQRIYFVLAYQNRKIGLKEYLSNIDKLDFMSRLMKDF